MKKSKSTKTVNQQLRSRHKNWKRYIKKKFVLAEKSSQLSHSKMNFFYEKQWYIIPYKEEFKGIFKIAHQDSGIGDKHCGLNKTMSNVNYMKFYFRGMEKEIKNKIKNCKFCLKDNIKHPIKVCKTILSSAPLERIQADLWEIPLSIRENIKPLECKYVLSCMDHLSSLDGDF